MHNGRDREATLSCPSHLPVSVTRLKKRKTMKKKNVLPSAAVLLFLILLMVFSAACNKMNNKTNTEEMELPEIEFPLVLKKEKEYRFDVITREGPFFGKVDDKDNLYAYFLQNQDGNCEVLKLSTDLELKKTFIIRRGQGPGEAINPRIYGGDEHFIIVWDAPARKYIKFDSDFKLLDEYRLSKYMGTFLYSGEHYVKEHNFVLEGFNKHVTYYDKFINIFKMKFPDDESKIVRDIKLFSIPYQQYRKDNDKMTMGVPLNFGWYFDHIYILNKRDYRILKMDAAGNVVLDKKVKFETVTFSEAERKKWIYKNYGPGSRGRRRFDFPEILWPACWMIHVGDGIAVGRCENYDPDRVEFVSADYFDPDLNYRGRIKLPYFRWWNRTDIAPTHADINFYSKGGKLYFLETRDDDDYWLVRYNIE
jgi:hypothetical protein